MGIPFSSIGGASFLIPKYSSTATAILGSKILNERGASTWVSILSAPSSISWFSRLKVHIYLLSTEKIILLKKHKLMKKKPI